MIHRGTFHHEAISDFQWQASRLASRWIGRQIQRYYLILLFLLCLPVMMMRTSDNLRGVIWSDAEGYYQYLPALFIIGDVHQLPPGSIWPYYNDQGEYVNKYTCGVAMFEWPFFFGAYFLSQRFGYDPADYVNPVYCRAISLSGFLFAFLGLWLLQRVLLRRHSPGVTAWVLFSIFAGTNLFHYVTKEMSVSHAYNFFLFAAFLYHLPKQLRQPTIKNSLLTGVLLGWIILIRPTNIILALALGLYDVYRWSELRARLKFWLLHPMSILSIIAAASLFFIPQMVYWHEMTGRWLYYSYTEEGFKYWYEPKITAVLFDPQNGLFLYSPLAILMLIAVGVGLWRRQYQALTATVIVGLATYIFASWWVWWFGGAFGHRCFVEYYTLLAIPLAGLYHEIRTRWHPVAKTVFVSLTILLMFVGIRLSFLYTTLPGPWDGADWRWNWDKYWWVLEHLIR